MADDQEYEEQNMDDRNMGHTIGQPSVNAGMSRNLLHTNSIASQPNLPVSVCTNSMQLSPQYYVMSSMASLTSG